MSSIHVASARGFTKTVEVFLDFGKISTWNSKLNTGKQLSITHLMLIASLLYIF